MGTIWGFITALEGVAGCVLEVTETQEKGKSF